MNSCQRISAAFDHKAMDRVPIDFSGHRSSGISAIAYAKLRKYLGLPKKPVRVYDPIQQLAIVDDDVLTFAGADTVELGRAFAIDKCCWSDWVLPDGTLCKMPAWAKPERGNGEWLLRSAKTGIILARMVDGSLYFEQTHFPFAEQDNPDDLPGTMSESMWTAFASPPGPLVAGPEGIKVLTEGARRLRDSTDRAIIGLFGGNLLELGQMLYRNDLFFLLLAGESDRANYFLDKLVEMHLANLEKFLGAVGPFIDIIVFGDDLGMQTGPQISPATYRKFFKPRHQFLWDRAKKLARVKVMLHCCGGIRELLPDLIDAGLDAINPVQINCQGMDAARLKQDFGKDIVFWGGGCDTAYILPKATPNQITQHVKQQIQILSLDGGFVFQQVHNILADVPPENIVALFDAINKGT